MLKAVNLKIEYKKNPLGMDESSPRFSYELQGDGSFQREYRIIVQTNEKKIVWDSGFVKNGCCHNIVYKGNELKPFTRYDWHVQVKDETGKIGKSAEKAFFETGFLGRKWSAKWILGSLYKECSADFLLTKK